MKKGESVSSRDPNNYLSTGYMKQNTDSNGRNKLSKRSNESQESKMSAISDQK